MRAEQTVVNAASTETAADNKEEEEDDHDETETIARLSMEDMMDGRNERGIPIAKFIENVQDFAESFLPVPATAELMIGAFNHLYGTYKQYEASFVHKSAKLNNKIPELEKSLLLIRHLKQQQQLQQQQGEDCDHDHEESTTTTTTVRYSLADSIYARAHVQVELGVVCLWLGAGIMVEYTFEEALAFLHANQTSCERDLQILTEDLGFVRDQIVTSEVSMSRIYNWDVRRKRKS